ncbi:hypothetical protein XENOCAPTIV_028182 [Xenoophorus captivus]|uniref:Uncharacterized protein n=1 Tax=Xenoophorus captivus TaxID=1517983 RepID=A0ABV0QDB3_9TELE
MLYPFFPFAQVSFLLHSKNKSLVCSGMFTQVSTYCMLSTRSVNIVSYRQFSPLPVSITDIRQIKGSHINSLDISNSWGSEGKERNRGNKAQHRTYCPSL